VRSVRKLVKAGWLIGASLAAAGCGYAGQGGELGTGRFEFLECGEVSCLRQTAANPACSGDAGVAVATGSVFHVGFRPAMGAAEGAWDAVVRPASTDYVDGDWRARQAGTVAFVARTSSRAYDFVHVPIRDVKGIRIEGECRVLGDPIRVPDVVTLRLLRFDERGYPLAGVDKTAWESSSPQVLQLRWVGESQATFDARSAGVSTVRASSSGLETSLTLTVEAGP
jgi:hypothetical protein